MVIDADGLNALSMQAEVLSEHPSPRILTPHPGEFARLIGEKLEGDERIAAAVDLAARCKIIVVLKGHRTLITDGQRCATNETGNPGMATGGSGDVLTGLITALVCQGLEPFDAARLGVYLHGRAGDIAAARVGQLSVTAADILDVFSGPVPEVHSTGSSLPCPARFRPRPPRSRQRPEHSHTPGARAPGSDHAGTESSRCSC